MRSVWSFIRGGMILSVLAVSIVMALQPPAASAATPIYVRTDGDDVECNGEADAAYPGGLGPLPCAKLTVGAAITTVDPGGTVMIGAGTFTENLVVSKNLTLDGAGRTSTILDGGGGGSVVSVGGGLTVSISELTIQNGNASSGGGISNYGALTLTDVKVANNQATIFGGGIYHASTTEKLLISISTLEQNQATGSGSGGGGIYAFGTVTISDSILDQNTALAEGGGIALYGVDSLLDMTNSTVSNNSTSENNSQGGGISTAQGSATIYGSTITGNSVSGTNSSGGGISTDTDMTLQFSEVSGNTAVDSGGGIRHWYGNLNVSNTIVRNNTVSDPAGSGGGIYASLGTVTLSNLEVSGNTAADSGGGIHSNAGISITNTTISGNSSHFGGGLLISSSDPSSILNSTITANLDPSGSGVGGLYVATAVTIKNSIFAANASAECWDISGPNITSLGYNIEDTDTCGFSATGDQPNTDPLLGPLTDNGGSTQTHAPLPGSPAIDGGTNAGCPATDQRGVSRPIDGDTNGTATCDVGAVEELIKLFLPLIVR